MSRSPWWQGSALWSDAGDKRNKHVNKLKISMILVIFYATPTYKEEALLLPVVECVMSGNICPGGHWPAAVLLEPLQRQGIPSLDKPAQAHEEDSCKFLSPQCSWWTKLVFQWTWRLQRGYQRLESVVCTSVHEPHVLSIFRKQQHFSLVSTVSHFKPEQPCDHTFSQHSTHLHPGMQGKIRKQESINPWVQHPVSRTIMTLYSGLLTSGFRQNLNLLYIFQVWHLSTGNKTLDFTMYWESLKSSLPDTLLRLSTWRPLDCSTT